MPATALTDSERIANLESEVAELRACVDRTYAAMEAVSARAGLSGAGVTPLARQHRPNRASLKLASGGAR
jgi:hypothetical protein